MSEKKSPPASVLVGAPRKHARADKKMEFLFEKYLERHPDHEGGFDPEAICRWAMESGIYVPPKPPSELEQLRKRFSRHLSHRYITDPQQREVRALHAVPTEKLTPDGVKQGYDYYPLFTTEPDKIWASLGVRRDGTRNRVVQIATDRRSYVENNIFGATLPEMDFDFNSDAIESQLPTDYPDEAPDGHDDDDDTPI